MAEGKTGALFGLCARLPSLLVRCDDDGDGQSHVHVGSDILVTGRVAQMGRGIMTDVAGKMIGEMAKAMEATLVATAEAKERGEAPPPSVAAEAPSAVGMAADITKGKIKGLFGKAKSGIKTAGDIAHAFARTLFFKPVQNIRDLGTPTAKKLADMNARDIAHACRMVEGTARSMGIEVVD